MVSRKIKAVCLPLLLLSLLFAACLVLANELIKRPGVQQYLLKELSKTVGYDLRARDIELNLWQGIGISARDLEIRSAEGVPMLSASRIRIELKGRALLKGRILPTRLVLVEPAFELKVGKDGDKDPVSGDLEKNMVGALAAFTSLGVEGARVTLKGLPFDLAGVDMNLLRTGRNPLEITIFSRGAVDYNDRQIPFAISGTVTRKAGQSISGDLIVKSEAVPLAALPWPRDLPFHRGVAEIQLKVKGQRDGPIWVKGVTDVKDLDFSILDEGDKKRFFFESLAIPFQARYAAQALKVPWFKVQGADFSLDGNARFDFKTPSNPNVTLKVSGPAMPLARFKHLFPSSLLPSWIETRLFPCFSGGTVRLDGFSLKGTLQELEDLDLYENALTLSLDLTCKGLTAFEKGSGVPVQDLSGHVAVKNGILSVKDVHGAFGSSAFKTGTLRIETLYDDAPEYHASLSGSFDIADLLHQRRLDVIGPTINKGFRKYDMAWLLKPGAVNGRLDAQVKVAYQDEWDDPKVEGDFRLTSCRMDAEELIFPAVVKTGMLELKENGAGTYAAEGRWGDSDIQMSGSIGKTWKTGRADIKAKADLEGLLNRFYPSVSGAIHAPSRVPAQFTLSKAPDHWSFQGKLHPEGVFMENEAVSISPFKRTQALSFDGRYVPEKEVVFKAIKWFSGPDMPNKKALPVLALKGSYGMAGTTGIDADIKAQKLRLQDLGVRLKESDLSAHGIFSCDVHLTLPRFFEKTDMDHPTPRVDGRVAGRDISIRANGVPKPITDVNFKATFEKETCSIDFLSMKMGVNGCRVEGKLRGWEGLKGKLSVTSNYVDLSQLLSAGLFAGLKADHHKTEAVAGASPVHSQFVEQTDVDVRLDMDEGKWGEIGFGPLKAAGAIRAGDLYVNSGELGLKYGKVRFKGRLMTGETPEAELSTYLTLTRIPIKDLPKKFDKLKSYIEGDMSLEGLLYVKGRNKAEWLSSLTGGTNLIIENGLIKRSNVFIKILDFLSIENLFTKDASGQSGNGLKFDKIEGPIDIEKGVAQTEQSRLTGPVLNAIGRGKVDLIKGRVDGEVGVEPLGMIDMVISHIPIVGHLLTGEKEALYVDYFKVDGPLGDPDVRYIPFKSLGSGTIGFIKRLFTSPGHLYKSIANRKRDFERKGLPCPSTLDPQKDMGP